MERAGIDRSEIGLGPREDVDARFRGDRPQVVEDAPVAAPRSPGEWIRQNLFSSPLNALLTIVSGIFVAFVVYRLMRFIFVDADWRVIRVNMKGYMVGAFPVEQAWRLWVAAYFLALLAGVSFWMSRRAVRRRPSRIFVPAASAVVAVMILLFTVQTGLVRALAACVLLALVLGVASGRFFGRALRRPLLIAWVLAFPVVIVLVRGFGGVPPTHWGGFFFNIIAATVGIFASFPLGIALALGRRSDLPAVRIVSVAFIELFRGVPLVAWLIFSKYVVDLLLPPQLVLPDIIKAFIVMTLFSAAYVGEIVRGGLQGVPAGQYEAARALGLSTTAMTTLVVLPQALRTTIPAMIGHFISLFKDTSLFTAIEVTELLAAARRSASSLEFFGRDMETLLFAGLVFWVVAFSMSRWSQRLEVRLGVGAR
jgi:general L-amino acid transport system permease protein